MKAPGTAVAVAVALVASSRAALAVPQKTPIVARDFNVDLHLGAAHGSPRVIAMGGTTTALSEGAAGLLGNPGAVAMRPLGAHSTWDWDGSLGAFVPDIGSDFDNNGIVSTETASANTGIGALLGFYRSWALGLGATSVTHTLAPDTPAGEKLSVDMFVGRLVLGRTFARDQVSLGLGLRVGSFTLSKGASRLFSVSGSSAEAGILHAPSGRSWRWGLRFALPVSGSDVEREGCPPTDCHGYVLPLRAVVPWELAAGLAWRSGPLPWNVAPEGRFRDEPALVLAADLVVAGAVDRGAGLEAYVEHQLQRSGRRPSVSVRAGAEKEWVPGRLRVRGGTYWEGSRFDGVPGRLHLTAGAELRLFAFHFWDAERRVAMSIAIDGAARYGNVGLSIGFWH